MKKIATEFLTVVQCARHYDVSTKTVYKMIKSGVLPATKFGREHQIAWPDVWACEQGPRPKKEQHGRYRSKLMSRRKTAKRWGRSLRTVDRWLAAGLPTRNVGGVVRVNRQDAADWLNARYKTQRF